MKRLVAGLFVATFIVQGCASGAGFRMPWAAPGAPTVKPPVPTDDFAFLNWLGFVCIAGGIAALIVSTFVPIVPRKAAATAIVCGIGSVCLKVFLVKFLPVLLWVSVVLLAIGGVMMLYPWCAAWVHRNLKKDAAHLTAMGDTRAATALLIAAERRKFNPQLPSTASKRKALLERVTQKAKKIATPAAEIR